MHVLDLLPVRNLEPCRRRKLRRLHGRSSLDIRSGIATGRCIRTRRLAKRDHATISTGTATLGRSRSIPSDITAAQHGTIGISAAIRDHRRSDSESRINSPSETVEVRRAPAPKTDRRRSAAFHDAMTGDRPIR